MASNKAFSPKEWEVWIQGETTLGTENNSTSAMMQLDVDSVGMPSLNPHQKIDVRSGTGRTLKSKDFFQNNDLRVVELSLSGVWHDDAGHLGLLENITNSHAADTIIASGYTPTNFQYGESKTALDFDTITVHIKAPDQTHGRNIALPGCVVTNFSWAADINTDGGQYKWSATLQSGVKPNALNQTNSGSTAYANSTNFFLASATATKAMDVDVALQSFTMTIDNPAVFVGSKLDGTGYDIINRAAECAVTIDYQVKYDENTDTFINEFDTQDGQPSATNCFLITASNAGGVNIQNAVFTNVAMSEGDIMMLDCSMKVIDDGTDSLVVLDN